MKPPVWLSEPRFNVFLSNERSEFFSPMAIPRGSEVSEEPLRLTGSEGMEEAGGWACW